MINKTLSAIMLCGILSGAVNASDSTGVIPTGEPAAQTAASWASATDTVKMLAEKFDSLETRLTRTIEARLTRTIEARLTRTIEDRFAARDAELEARVAELEGRLRASDTRAADLAARLADSEAEVAKARCSAEAALAGRLEVVEAAMRRIVEAIAAIIVEDLAAYQNAPL